MPLTFTAGILTTDDTDGTDSTDAWKTLPIRVVGVIRGSHSDWNRERGEADRRTHRHERTQRAQSRETRGTHAKRPSPFVERNSFRFTERIEIRSTTNLPAVRIL